MNAAVRDRELRVGIMGCGGTARAHDRDHPRAGVVAAHDVDGASAGADRPSTHAAQIDELVDDLLAGRRHPTTSAGARQTLQVATALHASALEGGATISGSGLTADRPSCHGLHGAFAASEAAARLCLA